MSSPSRALPDFTMALIRHGRIQLEELLGSGAFGAVYRGLDVKKKLYCAVKVMFTPASGSMQEELLHREIEHHMRVSKHKNVVTLHGHWVEGPFTFLLLKLCWGENLYTRIQRRQFQFNDELIRSTMIQVIDGLQYCHDASVYHRDLKPENILTASDGRTVLLADFGLSTTEFGSDAFRVGTLPYMSPECIGSDYKGPYYSPMYNDIWSMGIILFNLVTGGDPWDSAQTTDKLFKEYLKNPAIIAHITPVQMSPACSKLIQSVLNVNAMQRISLAEMRSAIENMDSFFMEPRKERLY